MIQDVDLQDRLSDKFNTVHDVHLWSQYILDRESIEYVVLFRLDEGATCVTNIEVPMGLLRVADLDDIAWLLYSNRREV